MVEDASSFWTDIQRYEDMLAADPRSYCFAPLSELYRKLRLLDDAISVAKKGCDLHPGYPGGFFALGTAYYEQGLNAEARQALERVIALKSDNFRAQKLLGQLYVEAGEIALAKKLLGQVLEQNPDDLESTLLLRSVTSTAAAAHPDREFPEEADDIEELTEVLDEPEEPEELEESEAPSVFDEVATAAGYPGGYDPFEESEESEEFWAIEPPEEPAAPELSGACEETGRVEERSAAPEAHTALAVPETPAACEEAGARQQPNRNPLTTATLAELYVSQGFIERALTIYKELLLADPANQPYRLRCAELADIIERQQQEQHGAASAPGSATPAAREPAPQTDVEDALDCWLENIRRRKDGV